MFKHFVVVVFRHRIDEKRVNDANANNSAEEQNDREVKPYLHLQNVGVAVIDNRVRDFVPAFNGEDSEGGVYRVDGVAEIFW